jgi:hypothetical protein
MNINEAIVSAFYLALNNNVSVPVFTQLPEELAEYVHINFDTGGVNGTKTSKDYLKRMVIDCYAQTGSYSGSRKRVYEIAGEVEDELFPTIDHVIPMPAGYRMTRLMLVDSLADDVLYQTIRVLRISIIFEFEIELT